MLPTVSVSTTVMGRSPTGSLPWATYWNENFRAVQRSVFVRSQGGTGMAAPPSVCSRVTRTLSGSTGSSEATYTCTRVPAVAAVTSGNGLSGPGT